MARAHVAVRPEPTRLATLALLGVTAAWGSTFFLTKDLLEQVPATDYLAVRFTIAAVVMVIVFRGPLRRLNRRQWRDGLALGCIYAAAQIVQTVGLGYTSASLSGFITGVYVVLTPLIGALVLRDRVGPPIWAAVLLSVLGLGVLSIHPGAGGGLAFGYGEWLTLGSSVLYAVHILGLGRYSTPSTAAGLSVVQMIALSLVCTVVAVPDGLRLPQTPGAWGSVVYMAVVAGAAAMWAQTWAQAHLSAARAAILMTMEPVFAAGFAMLFGGESLTPRIALGGALIVAAMYVAEQGSVQETGQPPPVHPSAP
ncbi:MAG: DMT family transporter [Actinomycetales bacterium]